jgi:hypothetical protein
MSIIRKSYVVGACTVKSSPWRRNQAKLSTSILSIEQDEEMRHVLAACGTTHHAAIELVSLVTRGNFPWADRCCLAALGLCVGR